MKPVRTTLSTLFATLILLLAACSQPAILPEAPSVNAAELIGTAVTFSVAAPAKAGYDTRVSFSVKSPPDAPPITGLVDIKAIKTDGSAGAGCFASARFNQNLCILRFRAAGVYNVQAEYSGDSNYSSSKSETKQVTVKYGATLEILADTPDPSQVDQAVRVQYRITAQPGEFPLLPGIVTPTPTGTVRISDGVNSCLSTVATGECSLILETAGARTLTATYSGDENFWEVTQTADHTVIAFASTTRITAHTPSPSTQGQAVNINYSVVANDPSKGIPSGNVTVSDGVDSCTATVAAGSCSISLSTLGTRTLTATYAGDTRFASSASDGEPHSVNPLDSTPPVITSTISGTLGNNGWYKSDVNLTWSVTDGESTISSQTGCEVQSITADTAGVTFTCSATSAGGTDSKSLTIKRDATNPVIGFANRTAPNAAGWNNTNVILNWTCTDATSGVVSAAVSQTLSSEGSSQASTGTCTDNAGHSASNTQSGIKIDKTAPTISAAATTSPNAAGWYKNNVSVHFTCTDALSGVTSCPADQVLSSEGNAIGSTAQTITDQAGNSSAPSNTLTLKIDKTAPSITFASRTAANAAGWNNTNVVLNWTCTDATSGVVSASVSQTLSTEAADQSSTGTCSDNAGNTASNTQSNINIDKSAPTLNPVVSPNPVLLNGPATVVSNASDSLSGLASQSCGALNTSSVGSKSVSCTATDNAGNSNSANASYSVAYSFGGFLQPVDSLPALNQVKAGQSIPVKFSLSGNQGLNILAANSPTSQTISCDLSAPVDDIEQTVTSGNSTLTYDASTDTYTYVWKTEKNWAGTCRQLSVTLADGSSYKANFKFK